MEALKLALLEKSSYTINEFCLRNSMSATLFHKLIAQGLGPKPYRVGAKVLITAEAEREWKLAMQNPTGRAAEIAERSAAMLKRKATAAQQGSRPADAR
ncbi:hypothetical protein NKI88_03170 [Mesorhizobium sp. M0317]|uniref:hypothetical protein n=1 Tax=Mesorhizobium sp. M0317 TaxID=2956935 RepID=UPI00333D5B56